MSSKTARGQFLDAKAAFGREFNPLGHRIDLVDAFALLYCCSAARLGTVVFDRKLNQFTVVEVGCYVGQTTRLMLDYGGVDKIYTIDIWEETPDTTDKINGYYRRFGGRRVMEVAAKNLRSCHSRVALIHGDSLSCLDLLQRRAIQMVFLDGSHEYGHVCQEIELYMPLIERGGILCGHDYNVFDGVTKAVDRLLPSATLVGEQGSSIWQYTIP